MAWSRSRMVAVISGPGKAGAVPGSLHQDGSAGVCLDAELVSAVVHDRLVAQRAGREVEPCREGLGIGAVVAGPTRAGGRGRRWRPARGRRCRRGLRRACGVPELGYRP